MYERSYQNHEKTKIWKDCKHFFCSCPHWWYCFFCSYAASKGGLLSATKSYAKVLGEYNINVNAVCPSVIKTNMTANTNYSAASIPLGHLGETKDIVSSK